MKASIVAIGTAVPTNRLAQMDMAEMVSEGLTLGKVQKRLLRSVYKATGIETRHTVLSNDNYLASFSDKAASSYPSTAFRMKIYKEYALPLAIKAIENCFKPLGDNKLNEVTHLITVSCTGMYAPGIDIEIIQKLNLNSHIKRTAINFMGCYGAFNALKVADAICKADPASKVLVVCIELCTLHFQHNANLDNVISGAIFSDGAAAVLIESESAQKKQFSMEVFHCDLLPQTSQDMAWQIGDTGFDIVLKSYVPEVIQSGIATFTEKLLAQSSSSIDLYAIHPGGIKILHACESSLSITKEQNKYSYAVLREFGNMSSATILFVLKAMWDDLDGKDDSKTIFSCAFGPGLTLESMLLKVRCH